MKLKACFIAVAHIMMRYSTHAAEVTSTITAGGDQKISSATFGPLNDQISNSEDGFSAFSSNATEGIYLTTLSQHPGRTFVATAPFSTSTGATSGSKVGSYSAVGILRRDSLWRIDPLNPQLMGTTGSFRLTFRYDWKQQVRGGTSQMSVNLSNGTGIFSSIDANQSQTKATNSGVVFWTSGPVSFRFGEAFNFMWRLGNEGSSVANPHSQATTSGWAQLWNLEVRDASDQILTRFSDYDWFEVLTNNDYPVATGADLPDVKTRITSINQLPDRAMHLNFIGSPGLDYRIWCSSDLTFPVTSPAWSILSTGSFNGASQSYTDNQAGNYQRRFYIISIP